MPTTANLIRINDGNFSELAERGISERTILTLTKARDAGMHFRSREDLVMLGLPAADIKLMLKHVDFRPTDGLPTLRKVTFPVRPLPLIGYTLRVESGELSRVIPVSGEGEAIMIFPPDRLGERALIEVRAPGGQRVDIEEGGSTVTHLDLARDQFKNRTITVRPVSLVGQAKPDVPQLGGIKGRLISGKSRRNLENISITIFVSTAVNSGAADFFPVAAASTETSGYFFTTRLSFPDPGDAGKLTAAKALIGLDPVVEKPIRLVPIRPGLGRLPDRLILFVDEGGVEESASECACGVLNFHEKKAVEEFPFYTVVRTTEPSIQAYTIRDIDEISLEDLFGKETPDGNGFAGIKVSKEALEHFLRRRAALTKDTLPQLLDLDRLLRLRDLTKGTAAPKGRVFLGNEHAVDWDDRPTIYQATSVAHGHLLHFKQEWFGDGYSLGDLLYSLPLAPGQKKQIVVFDWDRKESAANAQQTDYQEQLYNSLSRDRDVNEIAQSTLAESLTGSSRATTSGIGWGTGGGALGVIPAGDVPIPFGLLAGVAGGSAEGSSVSSQTGLRTATASSEQHIQDMTVQSANAVRSQRSTVIQTVSQGERFEISAEAVANYNHCHAMTIQYFEVLRHFQVQTRLADVQECLFIPLKMTPFDRTKALRWREGLVRHLRRRDLLAAFGALERVDEELSGSDDYYDAIGFPKGMFAEEEIEYIEGELYIEFHLTRPGNDDKDQFLEANWSFLTPYIGSPREFYETYLQNEKKRDDVFARTAGPRIAEEVLKELRILAVRNAGNALTPFPLNLDLTLLSEFRNRKPLHVTVRMKTTPPNLRRLDSDFIRIGFGLEQAERLRELLGKSLKMIVRSGSLRYRTANLSEYLFKDAHINNDLSFDSDGVIVATPLNRRELRKPRQEDVETANALLRHLNDNVEYYHQCIWARMDAQRRFMLLDGIIAPGRSGGRSVASVVENKLIGIVGNCLVMPVAPGFRLDPNLKEDVDLFDHYYEDPRDPERLSLPTKGVFAEAVMGTCNSCEKIEEDRFWRWEQSPIPDSPTAIGTVTPPTPTVTQPALKPQEFPAPIISIQNAPEAPAPQGFSGLVQLLSNPNLFRDVTGLSENQKNALQTLQRLVQSAEFFGQQGAELAKEAAKTLSPDVEELRQAKREGLLTGEKAREIFTKKAESRLEKDTSQSSTATELIKEQELLQQAVKESRISQEKADEISRLLREIREKENQSTIDREVVKEISRDSNRFEHETEKGEKTRIDRTPKPQKRNIRFSAVIRDTYGKPFTADTIPATDVLLSVSGDNNVAGSLTLQASGTEWGAILENAALSVGQVSVHLLDETDSTGNIVFTGSGDLNIAPDATFVRVSATMKSSKQTVKKTDTTTHAEEIKGKLDISLGGKLSGGFKLGLSKVLEVSANAERNLGIAPGISGGVTDTTVAGTETTLEVLIPTGNLDVVVS